MLQVGDNEKGSSLERLTSLYFEQQRKAGADLTAILQQAEDFQREVEQEIDGAINNKNMEELAAISQGKFEELLIQAYRPDLVYGNLEQLNKEKTP